MTEIIYSADRPVIETLVKAVTHTTPDIAEVVLRTMCLLQDSGQLTTFCLGTEELLQWFDSITPAQPAVHSADLSTTIGADTTVSNITVDPSWLNSDFDTSDVGRSSFNNTPELTKLDFSPLGTELSSSTPPDMSPLLSSAAFASTGPWIDRGFLKCRPIFKTTLSAYINSPVPSVASDFQSPFASPGQSLLSHLPAFNTYHHRTISTSTAATSGSCWSSDPVIDNAFSLFPPGYIWADPSQNDTRSAVHKAHLSAISMCLGTSINLLRRAEGFVDLLAFKLGKTTGCPIPAACHTQSVDLTQDDEDIAVSSLFIDDEAVGSMLQPLEKKILAVVEVMGQAMQAVANMSKASAAIGTGKGAEVQTPQAKAPAKPRKKTAPKEARVDQTAGSASGRASKKVRTC
ncbi:hypothetical protein K461DRAFT_280511 [Myriangium duriaei CBS 260.36]|uniref:Uncharacterized protein n=1 Tax=Myriangium duriaei CBS 260.36 TaxID=1168546 RepID=A0A9P4J182_9PEZI|nr:hypothetical protein K461DRAFT_280511 [Myriangium duriaei CBS 260.36]